MRSLFALLALTMSMGTAAACEMHDKHAANIVASAATVIPRAVVAASVTVLPQSKIVEESALAITKPKPAAAYGRGCDRERQTTVYLTQ